MRFNALLILFLLAIVIAAPIVDAIACDDCKHIGPLQERPQRFANCSDHSDGTMLSSDNDHRSSQGAATAQDLCPVCANTAAAMGNACSGAPFLTGQTSPLPKLIAFSDPSYSISKPPQN